MGQLQIVVLTVWQDIEYHPLLVAPMVTWRCVKVNYLLRIKTMECLHQKCDRLYFNTLVIDQSSSIQQFSTIVCSELYDVLAIYIIALFSNTVNIYHVIII